MTASASTPWREYQEQTAELFRSFDLEVAVEEVLAGARSQHEIDVVVRFQSHGLDHLWICECKRWQRAVPQEKIDALATVVDDVGANHGLCFSESGFQPGAFGVASNRNITLTSLAEFRSAAGEELLDTELRALAAKAYRVSEAIDGWVESVFPVMADRITFLFGACPIGSMSTANRSLVDTIGRALAVGYPQTVATVLICDEVSRVFQQLWGVWHTLGSVEVSTARELRDVAVSVVGTSAAVSQDLQRGRIPHPQV